MRVNKQAGTSPAMHRAIAKYAQDNDLKPTWSTPPTYYFLDADGKETKVMGSVLLEYAKAKKKGAKRDSSN